MRHVIGSFLFALCLGLSGGCGGEIAPAEADPAVRQEQATRYKIGETAGMHYGGGSWILNEPSGYYLGRAFDNWTFDNVETSPHGFHFGRVYGDVDMCGWIEPGVLPGNPLGHPSASCSSNTKAQLQNRDSFGKDFNCPAHDCHGGTPVYIADYSCPFYFNYSRGVPKNMAGMLPYNELIWYRYTTLDGEMAVVRDDGNHTPNGGYNWGFIPRRCVKGTPQGPSKSPLNSPLPPPGPICGQIGGTRCEFAGNHACNGVGPKTADCDHCCGGLASPPCGAIGGNRCEFAGNRACNGVGPTTFDCDHCCGGSASPPCGAIGGNRCEFAGNRACNGVGPTTFDCEHCCGGSVAPSCGAIGGNTCEWNDNACGGQGQTTFDCQHCCYVPCGVLNSGQDLYGKISSCDGRFSLWLQPDGNLVLYQNNPKVALWYTGTYNGHILRMQPDGNLVLYSSSYQPVWQSHTYGQTGAWAGIQPDGNFVVYSATHQALWQSHTCCH